MSTTRTIKPAAPAVNGYIPNRTLGGSGYIEAPGDRLYMKVNQLDALLMLMSGADEDSGMFPFNAEIQRELVNLASSLAHEINEAQEELGHLQLAGRAAEKAAA